jgi:hypothetical protein
MRWVLRTLLILVLVALVALPSAWLTRDHWLAPAVQWSVNTWAATRGSADPVLTQLRFRLESLSPDGMVLTGIDVNGAEGLTADRVDVQFDAAEVLAGRIRSAVIEQPRLSLAVTEAGDVTLAGLEPLRRILVTGGKDDAAPSPVPAIEFSGADLTIAGVARGRVYLSGTVGQRDGALSVAADGSVDLQGPDWHAKGVGGVRVSRADGGTRLTSSLGEARLARGDLVVTGLRGTAAVDLGGSGDLEATADLRADSAEAAGVAVAVPSAHLRLDPLGLSAVARLGDPGAPELRIAVTADVAEAGRRPVAVDLAANLATLDRLIAAARQTERIGLAGETTGVLRGSMPNDLTDPLAWRQVVVAGALDLAAASPVVGGAARLGVAVAAGTLAVETLAPATLSVRLDDRWSPAPGLPGNGPFSVVLGQPTKALRALIRNPLGTPHVTVGGPIAVAAPDGAGVTFDGEIAAVTGAEPTVEQASGALEITGVAVDGLRVHEARLALRSLQGDGQEIRALGDLTAELDAAGIDDMAVALPLRLIHDDNGTAVFLDRPGSVTVRQLAGTDTVSVDGPVNLRLDPARRAALRRGFGDGDAIRLAVPFALPALEVLVQGGVPATVSLAPSSGTLSARIAGGRAGGVLRLATEGAQVVPAADDPDAPDGVVLRGLAVEVSAGDQGLDRVVFAAERLSDRARIGRFAPLAVEGQATRVADGALEFTTTFRGADGAFVLDAAGFHDVAAGSGRAYLTLFPLVFVPGGLQPVDLSPAAAAMLRHASGKVSLKGAVAWPGGVVPPDEPLTVALEDLDFTGTLGTVSGLTGAVTVSGVDPLVTLPAQRLAATGIDVGMPIADPEVTFRLEPDLTLVLETIRARFADGRVQADAVRVPLTARDPVSLVLEVEGVDAGRLAEVTELEGLTATGALSGRLPLVWDYESGLSLRRARLAATDSGGSLRYQPEAAPPALRDAGEEVSLFLRAVQNLVYDQFEIEADGRPGEPFDVKLRVRGANPDLFDGYPVALNVSLSGQLDELFLNARRTLGLSDVLQRKLEARGAGG